MLIYQHKCENKYIFINYSVVLETNKFLSISNFRFIVEIELTKITESEMTKWIRENVNKANIEKAIELYKILIEFSARIMTENKEVHELIKKKGLTLGRERKDHYVNELFKFMKKDGSRKDALCDRLLFSAMIEARSCERFKVLSENIQDEELSKFYRELMESEAGHYTTFITYARKYGNGIDVEKRWREWIAFEAQIIANYGNKETIHG